MAKAKFYRFTDGTFIEANSFEQAKAIFIVIIQEEKEDPDAWHNCTCLGFDHRHDCPEKSEEVPY